MAYFKLSAPTNVIEYPFDYHSHFSGILPVHGSDVPSLASWLDASGAEAGEQALFEQALGYMIESNPFDKLMNRADKANYERGECAAENIYIACVIITRKMQEGEGFDELPVWDRALYSAALKSVRAVMGSTSEDRRWMLALMKYFNGKIYSSNKFTPFDDAYKMRSMLSDRVKEGPDGEEKYRGLFDKTLEYLKAQGINHTQIPVGMGDVDVLDSKVHKFNQENDTEYRVILHTPSAYVGGNKFAEDLDSILKKLLDEKLKCVIGLDVLGVENRVANYSVLFNFLRDHRKELEEARRERPKSRSIVVHIHNGEGASAAADHRSMIGYYLAYGDPKPGDEFFKELSAYIGRCVQTAKDRRSTESAGSRGAPGYGAGVFSRLFEELFLSNSLTYRGCLLRRFDINGERSRELAAYNGKRSVMALSELLDEPAKVDGNPTWYEYLTAKESPYTFRLGHEYYYRNFMAARYPKIVFDTNLGSNAITGAAALFRSAESYRINRGFRRLDGYIDTDVLEDAAASIVDMSNDPLTQEQMNLYFELSHQDGDMQELLGEQKYMEPIHGFLKRDLGILGGLSDENEYKMYVALVVGIVQGSKQPAIRYQALTRVQAVFRNWRSYLLGADGQGAEHSDIQNEFVRMVILVAYHLLPVGQNVLATETLTALQQFIVWVAQAYWLTTVGRVNFDSSDARRNLRTLEGYQAPASVVCLQRGEVFLGS